MKIICIIGPSGTGKTTLLKDSLKKFKQHPDFGKEFAQEIISHTTRTKRPGEIEGHDYYFVDKKTFDTLTKIENVKYSGNYYCISKEAIDSVSTSTLAFVICNLDGYYALKEAYGEDVISIFIYTSFKFLENRLINRGDAKEKIKERLENVVNTDEYSSMKVCDYIFINDNPLEESKSLFFNMCKDIASNEISKN